MSFGIRASLRSESERFLVRNRRPGRPPDRALRREIVPQFRDGYTDIRRRWDAAVCDALAWDTREIAELGKLLADEPYVRGVAYGQWKA